MPGPCGRGKGASAGGGLPKSTSAGPPPERRRGGAARAPGVIIAAVTVGVSSAVVLVAALGGALLQAAAGLAIKSVELVLVGHRPPDLIDPEPLEQSADRNGAQCRRELEAAVDAHAPGERRDTSVDARG